MIVVYGAPPTRGMRVIWMLEEMGLDYEVRAVDFATRFQNAEFLAASPSGAMPGIVDGEVRMMESVAILEYLSARHGPTPLVPEVKDADFPLYQQFLHYGEASLAAPLNVAIASRFFAPEAEKRNWGAEMAKRMVVGRWGVVAAQLKSNPYVAGARFTAADISCGYALGMMGAMELMGQLDPVLPDYLARVRARPAFGRAMAHTQALPG